METQSTAQPETGGTPEYSDGALQDQIKFFDAKLILKPTFFGSARGFRLFSELVAEAVDQVKGVHYSPLDLTNVRPRIREVRFLDTQDFRLYNNSFILRQRTSYQDGFPVSDPEIVFKFRNPDRALVASIDVRPKVSGPYRVKFKSEGLPLKDEVGSFRLLYSHNAIFPMSSVHDGDRTSLTTIARILPPVATVLKDATEHVELVNGALVEEVQMDLGSIDFGKGNVTKSNISLWRSLGDHNVMCGEFAYQAKFNSVEDISEVVKSRVEELFIKLQLIARDWLLLGVTKTGLVYQLKGNPPQAHE
jgi:hypothetical protein